MITHCYNKILAGQDITFDEALKLVRSADPDELYKTADELRKRLHNNAIDLCSIVNAKSGQCSEDCKFCAQSLHHRVEIATYDVVDIEKAVFLAKENELHGVHRFSLVTAGRAVAEKHLQEFKTIYQRLQKETRLSFCASMGLLTFEKAHQLKEMGVTRYHCNLETSRSFFPKVCTSHSWDDKILTINFAKKAGLEICSGGIIGMGESLAQRLELAFELRELEVLSIPLNILTPIENTPLAHLKPLSVGEVLTAVAMFRFINPRAIIRLAGGRTLLGDEQERCFSAGANGSIVGNYLTTIGKSLVEDIAMFRRLGFDLNRRGDD